MGNHCLCRGPTTVRNDPCSCKLRHLKGHLISSDAHLHEKNRDKMTFTVDSGTEFVLKHESQYEQGDIIVSLMCNFKISEQDVKLCEEAICTFLKEIFNGKSFLVFVKSEEGESSSEKTCKLSTLIPDGVTDITRERIIDKLTDHLHPDYETRVQDDDSGILCSDGILKLIPGHGDDNMMVFIPKGTLFDFQGKHRYKLKIPNIYDYLVPCPTKKQDNAYEVTNDDFEVDAVTPTLSLTLYYYFDNKIPIPASSPLSKESILKALDQLYQSTFKEINVAIIIIPNAISDEEPPAKCISATVNIEHSSLTPNSVVDKLQQHFLNMNGSEPSNNLKVLPVPTTNSASLIKK